MIERREYGGSLNKREYNEEKKILREEPPELFSVYKGKIASIQEYGAFVAIEGFKKQGLVHISQISKQHLEGGRSDIEKILEVGEDVYVKVVWISEDYQRISLSLKYANQTDGTDLDPNGAVMMMENNKKKKLKPQERRIVNIDAVLKTTCNRCKGKGHMATECYATLDSEGNFVEYSLLPEIPFSYFLWAIMFPQYLYHFWKSKPFRYFLTKLNSSSKFCTRNITYLPTIPFSFF